ncbi:Ribonuclease H protein [Quillaja saponaria]|uniref:Ribonuclease H protein n=1 Tax=Quillaja saponaria TaxID=32244 RepID=A0AAD7LFN8_QUISA|nr:Ribonuclease H protein [Quillaja saponaria]
MYSFWSDVLVVGWVKINTDGASGGNPGCASAAGILRNDCGEWIVGFAKNLGWCNSFHAELWALKLGLQHAWEQGYRKIIVDVDSQAVVEVADRNYNNLNSYRDYHGYSPMLTRGWEVEIRHAYMEVNRCADWLANKALDDNCLSYWWEANWCEDSSCL